MRPVNLLPPEDRRGEHAPLRAGVASYAIIGVLVVALVGVVLVIMTGNQITDSKAELASLQARQAQADLAASKLAPYQDFATLVGRAQRDRREPRAEPVRLGARAATSSPS